MPELLHIIILAAGAGTRMKSRVPKVLQTVGGRPMITHVLDTALTLRPAAIHVVFNPAVPEVRATCDGYNINWAAQAEQLGTGHAVQQAMPGVPDDANVLVLYADTPLLEADVLQQLIDAPCDGLKVLTLKLENPHGYGRILRSEQDQVAGIVEERDATSEQKAICEVNSGIIMARAAALRSCLQELASDNAQNEYYLTDVFAIARSKDLPTAAVIAPEPDDLAGANDRKQLAELERRYCMKKAEQLMKDGAQLADPARIDVRGEVKVGSDVFIDINVIFEGSNELGDEVQIGPGCVLKNCHLAAGTRVHAYSVLENMRSNGACDIGPFARVRPGTVMESGSKIGNFVEVKNTTLGENSKVSHLSYLGDSIIGDRVNIGAGTITCNYDGVNKHKTIIGNDVFVGSDTQLIAPVTVGEGANIGAGSTVTRNAPAGKLTLSRAKQVTIDGWKRPESDKD
jgi:bifunctional UDP-N-acetylglucosamine pyrophosphorylase/glucosamine-1-phosphate N-acetyltransferase